jgi:hypothetical protein
MAEKASVEPDMPARRQTAIEQVLRVLGDKTAQLSIGANDEVKTTYAANLEAQNQATEQSGLPSYGGIDAQNVMQLMQQRAVQDQQMRQAPLDLSQMNYQGALAGQARAQPQMKLMDMAMRMQQSADRDQTARDVAGIKSQGSLLDRIKADSLLNLPMGDRQVALFSSLKKADAPAKQRVIEFLVGEGMPFEAASQMALAPSNLDKALMSRVFGQLVNSGMSKYDTVEKLMSAMGTILDGGDLGITPEADKFMEGVRALGQEHGAAQGVQYTDPGVSEIAKSLLGSPNPNIAAAPDRAATLAAGDVAEAARIESEGTIPKNLMVKGAKTALGPVVRVDKSGRWAWIIAPNGEEFVVGPRN